MKTTLNVNINQRAFTIDEDAYEVLKKYLDDVSERFDPSEAAETMNDVEARISDLFSSELTSSQQVVSTQMVLHAISVLGQADEFGSPHPNNHSATPNPRKQLKRSRNNKIIGGVCGGLADYFNADVSLVRLIAALLLIFGGSSFLVYIILWIAVPID